MKEEVSVFLKALCDHNFCTTEKIFLHGLFLIIRMSAMLVCIVTHCSSRMPERYMLAVFDAPGKKEKNMGHKAATYNMC